MNVFISVKDQKLIFSDGEVKKTYPVSTSKYGEGYLEGTNMTPLGNFIICEKIGTEVPLYGILKSRKFTGEKAEPGKDTDSDVITSRILRLKGLDEDNKNTYERYIYIHGTNDEAGIGGKTSHGCIRMQNRDIVELYDKVKEGCAVTIR